MPVLDVQGVNYNHLTYFLSRSQIFQAGLELHIALKGSKYRSSPPTTMYQKQTANHKILLATGTFQYSPSFQCFNSTKKLRQPLI